MGDVGDSVLDIFDFCQYHLDTSVGIGSDVISRGIKS